MAWFLDASAASGTRTDLQYQKLFSYAALSSVGKRPLVICPGSGVLSLSPNFRLLPSEAAEAWLGAVDRHVARAEGGGRGGVMGRRRYRLRANNAVSVLDRQACNEK